MDWRERLVMEAFEGRQFLLFDDLPPGIGDRTMTKLLNRNVVSIVQVRNGTLSKAWAWRLVH